MKRSIVIFMSLILFIILGTVVFASEKIASSKARQITGNVTAIDTKTNTVTVKKKNREVTLSVEEKTKIILCTPKTTISDIKIGDKVTAKYTEADAKNTAKSITIRETLQKGD
jgi:Cu/Ag efflux protein CusF